MPAFVQDAAFLPNSTKNDQLPRHTRGRPTDRETQNAARGFLAAANGSTLLPNAKPGFVRYAWHVYPAMQLYSAASGRPVVPFKLEINESSWSA